MKFISQKRTHRIKLISEIMLFYYIVRVLYYPTSSSTSNMREAFGALKNGELTKFSSCRDISSEVLHLFYFIFHRDPRYSRRGKKHKATYGAVMPEHALFVKRFSLIYEIVLQTPRSFLQITGFSAKFCLNPVIEMRKKCLHQVCNRNNLFEWNVLNNMGCGFKFWAVKIFWSFPRIPLS